MVSKESYSGKEITIRSEICYSWGYSYKVKVVMNFLQYIIEKYGVKVSFKEKKVTDGDGEYNIVQEVNGKDNYIFSNDSSFKDAVYGSYPDKSQYDAIFNKIVFN